MTAPSTTTVVDTWQMSLPSVCCKPGAFSRRYRVFHISRDLFCETRLIDDHKPSFSYLPGVFFLRLGLEERKPDARKKALGL